MPIQANNLPMRLEHMSGTPIIPNVATRTFGALVFAFVLLTSILIFERPADARDAEYAPFLGSYTGNVDFATTEGLESRNLEVAIRREADGFSVEWSTITRKPSGKLKRNTYFAAFKPVTNNVFYTSAMFVDRFGTETPVDPIYAKIEGNKMTVFAFLITADGHHELQTYERILVPGGMKLKFTRVRDHKMVKTLKVSLTAGERARR